MTNIKELLDQQDAFFKTHQTKDVEFRIQQLKRLKQAILAYEERLTEALWKDLHKSRFEAYATEIGITLSEVSHHIRNLRKWSKPQRVHTNQLIHFWSTSKILREPYGRVLIIAPWNYPFQLVLNPLIGAISAGNTAVIKPSEFSVHTGKVVEEMLSEFFSPSYIKVFLGEKEMSQALLQNHWDYIFFTGSQQVGKIVMQAAAERLIPVSLELGGKSPCIVDQDANLKIAATRIVWGKFINAGQTCIAPDYLFVHKAIRANFTQLLREQIRTFFGEDPSKSEIFPRIIAVDKLERLKSYLLPEELERANEADPASRYFPPIILEGVTGDHPVMKQEIFGPIIPILEFTELQEVIDFINNNPKPLAFYYFSEDRKKQKMLFNQTSSGGGCINDVLIHFSSHSMPFGGVGRSGLGGYHGKSSFETFSHQRSVMQKTTLFDIPVRYPPYTRWKLKMAKMVLR